jgi:hypothetical protein
VAVRQGAFHGRLSTAAALEWLHADVREAVAYMEGFAVNIALKLSTSLSSKSL